MRRAAIALSAVALAFPAPGFAQSHTASSPSAAVAWTCQQSLIRRGYSEVVAYGACAGDAAAQAVWDEMVGKPFYYMMDLLGIQWPRDVSNGGSLGGGGAGASWDEDCADFAYKRDVANNIIVPSIPLPGGGALAPGSGTVWGASISSVSYIADSAEALFQLRYHYLNMGRGSDRRAWVGVYALSDCGGGYMCAKARSIAHYNASNVLVPVFGQNYTHNPSPEYKTTDVEDKPCPQANGGGTFHYYAHSSGQGWNFPSCLMYSPNSSLSPSGYAYNWETTIPGGVTSGDKASRAEYMASYPEMASCILDEDLIADVADRYFDRITDRPEYDGPPYAPVLPEDVRNNGEDPTVDDLNEDTPADPPPSENTPSEPTPVPSPTPTATPTSGPDYTDPEIGAPGDPTAPTGLMDPIFDWLPDLPSIEINVAGAACPTWEMQPFAGPEWHLVMDSHCGFIEDNRAAIGALMVVLFTIGAAMIILRA